MPRPSLDEIFGNTNTSTRERPSLDEIFGVSNGAPKPSLDELFGATSKPKPQFNSIEEAAAGMKKAKRDQYLAERNANGAFGFMPYLNAMDKTGVEMLPFMAGGGVSMGLSKALGPKIMGQALAGGGGGLVSGALSPADNLQQRALNTVGSGAGGFALGGGLTAAGNVVKGIGSGLSSVNTRLNNDKAAGFASTIQKAFVNTKVKAVDKFGKELETLAEANPTKKISISSALEDYSNPESASLIPNEVKNIMRKTPILKDVLKGTRSADDISLKEAQEMVNYLNAKVPANLKRTHLELPELISDIKASQLDAFPGMTDLRSEYAKVAEPYKNLKNYFKFNRTLAAIDNDFGGAQGKLALKKLFGDNPDILSEIESYKNAGRLIGAAKEYGPGALKTLGVGTVGYGIAKSIK